MLYMSYVCAGLYYVINLGGLSFLSFDILLKVIYKKVE